MPRELNPDLFGMRRMTATVGLPSTGGMQGGAMQPGAEMPSLSPRPPEQVETTEAFRRKIRDLENQIQVLTQRMEKMAQHVEQRLTHSQNSQKSLEMSIKNSFQEVAKNQATTTSKMTERRVSDAKIQDMVDRHNQLVLNFEQRMQAAQKVTSEQEMKLMTYQATIDEILREIRNFKR